MTIVGLFRRYQRWNPVHPTYGAFWGMGIGVGCGVGWGPGFGPDAVGFVGGGCGVGFSVGLTFIGFGIGLPASGLPSLPYDALRFVSSEALNLTKTAIPRMAEAGGQSCRSFSHRVGEMEKNLMKRVQNSNLREPLGKSRWSAVEVTIKTWEQKLKVQASQALRLINQKGPSDNSQ